MNSEKTEISQDWEEDRRNEQNKRLQLITDAHNRNYGKLIEDETRLCDTFLEHFYHPVFTYLQRYEWEYVRGQSHCGAGDLVFSSCPELPRDGGHPPSWNRLAVTSDKLKIQTLVVEVKYLQNFSGSTARNKRTKSRSKVKEQLYSSMKAWQKLYPSHEIYGAILSNDRQCSLSPCHKMECIHGDDAYLSPIFQLESVLNLPTEDDPYEGDPPIMEIEDVLPRFMWGNSSRAHIDFNLWTAIKTYEFERTNFCCEKCGLGGLDDTSLVLHQRWKYSINGHSPNEIAERMIRGETFEDDKRDVTASFYRFDVLCIPCHKLAHIFRSLAKNELNECLIHFRDHSSKSLDDVLNDLHHIQLRYRILDETQPEEWKVSWPKFFSHPMVVEWENSRVSHEEEMVMSLGKFGNCCCFATYNPGNE